MREPLRINYYSGEYDNVRYYYCPIKEILGEDTLPIFIG